MRGASQTHAHCKRRLIGTPHGWIFPELHNGIRLGIYCGVAYWIMSGPVSLVGEPRDVIKKCDSTYNTSPLRVFAVESAILFPKFGGSTVLKGICQDEHITYLHICPFLLYVHEGGVVLRQHDIFCCSTYLCAWVATRIAPMLCNVPFGRRKVILKKVHFQWGVLYKSVLRPNLIPGDASMTQRRFANKSRLGTPSARGSSLKVSVV